jgi:hypothetical protein
MARELIGHEPWVREVIDFDRRPRRSERRKGRHSGLFGLLRFGAELAPKQFDRMVLFSDHPGRAIIVCWRAGIRTILGFGDSWLQRLLLTKSPWINRYRGPAVAAFAIAQGFCNAPIVPRISVRPDALARMRERLAAMPRPLHVLAIGASESYKQWGEANFVELANRLAARGHGAVLLGGPAEAGLAQAIHAGIDPALRWQRALLPARWRVAASATTPAPCSSRLASAPMPSSCWDPGRRWSTIPSMCTCCRRCGWRTLAPPKSRLACWHLCAERAGRANQWPVSAAEYIWTRAPPTSCRRSSGSTDA